MRRDSRLSVALHALLHMSDHAGVLTSEVLATMLHTNAVVVRRTMGRLREAGLVRSEKGHGGGWSLARALDAMTVGDVYAAIGSSTIFSIGVRDERPGCLVEQAVNRALGHALGEAEALLVNQLRSVSVAEVLADARAHHARSPKGSAGRG